MRSVHGAQLLGQGVSAGMRQAAFLREMPTTNSGGSRLSPNFHQSAGAGALRSARAPHALHRHVRGEVPLAQINLPAWSLCRQNSVRGRTSRSLEFRTGFLSCSQRRGRKLDPRVPVG